MPRYKHYSYAQGQFISVQFSRQILPDSFEYALNYIVDNEMDMSVFDARVKNDETGAPAYDPRILLKVVLYAYSKGFISSRDIEAACQENVMFMALSANTRPHFTTIADFISTMTDGIEPLFLDVLMYCDKLGLIGKEMFAIDGCKISSNASKEWSGTKADFEKKKKKYEASIEYLLMKHKEEDKREDSSTDVRKKEAKAKESMAGKIKKIQEWLDTHEDKPGKQGGVKKSHLIDNESAKMVSSHGVVQGYNGVAVVDAKHQVVLKAEAYGNGSEQETLKPMVEGVAETFKQMGEEHIYKEVKLLADSGFNSEDNMEMLKDKGIDAYVADNQFRKRDPRFESAKRHKTPVDRHGGKKKGYKRKYFGPDDFQLDEQTGKLRCPAGNLLHVKNRNFRLPKGSFGIAYQAKATDCRGCQIRSQCLRNSNTQARQVHKLTGGEKPPNTSYSRWMRDRIDSIQGRFIYSRRMGIVEPLFANIRDKLGLDRFLLRGVRKVGTQWKLYTMVHNMLKAYRYGWQATGAG